MGSSSDLPVMEGAQKVLRELGVACQMTVVSAHRTPDRMVEYARGAAERGVGVIIAGALVGEKMVNKGFDSMWESRNKGKLFKDLKLPDAEE